MGKKNLLPGVFDILPEDDKEPWRSSHLWREVEEVIYAVATQFGYREIRFPILERTELFKRSVGEGTDIVNKEMYTFEDRGGRSVSLRPEGTAPAIRAFIEGDLANKGSTHKLFYMGPMFRYERSQAGRYRQHHQFGVEAIGPATPEQDVEVIDLIMTVYQRLGLKDLELWINNLGNREERASYRDELKTFLTKNKASLSEDSQKRLEINPLRILDSKAEEDQKIVAEAPSILNYVGKEGRAQFERVQELLDNIGIPYSVKPTLVRGLDYYNNTVFEVTANVLGAQNSLVGGGRYDGLIKTLGGPDLPAIGFGCGMERLIQTMLKQLVDVTSPPYPTLFLIALDDKARLKSFQLLHELRHSGIAAQMDYSGRKLNKVMQQANQLRAQYVVVIGERELEAGNVTLKTMTTGHERQVQLNQLVSILQLEKQKGLFNQALKPLSRLYENKEDSAFFLEELNQELNQTQQVTSNLQKAVEEIGQLLEPEVE